MATVARAEIEALLRARKLDTTLTSSRPFETLDERYVVATGIQPLDDRLRGGLARGQISEVVGPRSSGRTSVVLSAMAGAAARGELVALVDTFDTFDPVSARACGVDLTRLLWIRGVAATPGGGLQASDSRLPASSGLRPRKTRSSEPEARSSKDGRMPDDPNSRALDRALKAFALILAAGGFGLVVLDVADLPASAIKRLPFTTWFRLQRPIEGSSTACVILANEPVARSAGGATVTLRRMENGGDGMWGSLFSGFEVEAHVGYARGVAETCRFACAATP